MKRKGRENKRPVGPCALCLLDVGMIPWEWEMWAKEKEKRERWGWERGRGSRDLKTHCKITKLDLRKGVRRFTSIHGIRGQKRSTQMRKDAQGTQTGLGGRTDYGSIDETKKGKERRTRNAAIMTKGFLKDNGWKEESGKGLNVNNIGPLIGRCKHLNS